ncbi:TonB-dependent receptor [Sphingobacterium sp.]|uniref:SusC/RagA family TonB-linked outer membrane protein n=1 Tax=Sphingobacterium sp. TaxID=341027 RepID=UPI00289D3463|nr:TonB-dependent receptor [Sphingobacterium sp.]
MNFKNKNFSFNGSVPFIQRHLRTLVMLSPIFLGINQGQAASEYPANTYPEYLIRPNKQRELTGTVRGQNGEPLVGATVKVKSKDISTQTDAAGKFSISVENTDILVVSYTGYTAQEVPVGQQASLDIILKQADTDLDEVVVIGYGTTKKSDLTGSVVSANLEALKAAPNTNLAQSLQGVAPGLNIGQVNSAGQTPEIEIRGATTINGNTNVLIVLDGIIYNGNLASINPDDIASVDVLKDASSTAIYGAQAANGVLLITSKKGKAGKTKISYTGSYSTQKPTVGLRPLNREEFIEKVRDLNYRDAFLEESGYLTPNPDYDVWTDIESVMPSDADIQNNNFDWWKAGTKTGHVQEHQLSISGGSEKLTYLLSAGLTDQAGFIINDNFKRHSFRLNMENRINNWLTIGIQSFASISNRDGSEPTINALIRHSPLLVPYGQDGKLIPSPTASVLDNPFMTYEIDDLDRDNSFFGNFYGEIKFPFIKGLSYRLNFGNNYRVQRAYQANPYGAGLTGSASRDERQFYDYTVDNIFTYNRNFAGVHDISATLLYSVVERMYSRTNASATNFPNFNLGYNSLEQGLVQKVDSDAEREAMNSQMARINYKLHNRYLLTGTLRRDGFSGFASNEKWAMFPSAAVGWILSEEDFFKAKWVDQLKFRISYGVNGNLISRYASQARFQRGRKYIFGDGAEPVFGQYLDVMGNPDLRWERTGGFNYGIDFSLFKGRLSGSAEAYRTVTKDLLFNVSLPGVTGIDEITTNLGQVNNHGFEFTLSSKNITGKDFTWNTTLNFSTNKNKIVSLVGLDANKDGIEDDLVADNLFIGHSIQSLRGYQSNGIYQLNDEIPAGYYPGTGKIVDQNGDGKINAQDQIILGNREPDFRFSILNTFTYKNFTLSAFLNAVQGDKNSYLGTVISPDIGGLLSANSMRLNYFEGIDYWSPSNPDARFPRSHLGAAANAPIYANRNFIRLQDVTVSYRFQGGLIEKLNLENLSVYFNGKNLATWTDWQGWDPETGQGFNDSGRPVLKGYSVGLNVTF